VPLLAVAALVCFAANSVLARVALRGGAIDPASFTALRLGSGALCLALLARARAPAPGNSDRRAPLAGALLLFLYAAPFSFAYLSLSTGTGALILFGAVQLTMIGAGVFAGERPSLSEWTGLLLAVTGLIGLNLPGLTAPPLGAALLMAVAGVAWGGYSLRGRRSTTPLRDTSRSFLLAAPIGLALALAALGMRPATLTTSGVMLAIGSGALASGAGYAAWYAVLPRLSATRAGTIQLAVPVIAALAGIALLGETVSLRLLISGVAVLGGIGLAIYGTSRSPDP
jgi:drug/metabolite transporter (DMT)-like permease